MNRRSFLIGATAFLAAPAIVRAGSLEYVPHHRLHPGWVHLGDDLWQFKDQTVVGQTVYIPESARAIHVWRSTFLDFPKGGALMSRGMKNNGSVAMISARNAGNDGRSVVGYCMFERGGARRFSEPSTFTVVDTRIS